MMNMNQPRTKIIMLCLLLACTVALAGCNKEKENAADNASPTPNVASATQPTEESSASSASEPSPSVSLPEAPDPDSDTGNPIDPETPPSTKEGETASFIGTIVDAGMGQFLIELDNGVSLTVDYTSADVSKLTDSMPGNSVKVTYTGTIDGADTSDMTVLSIEQA